MDKEMRFRQAGEKADWQIEGNPGR
jgi:hypothetical protein